jgi:hypothetical protein
MLLHSTLLSKRDLNGKVKTGAGTQHSGVRIEMPEPIFILAPES